MDLAARVAVQDLEGKKTPDFEAYADPDSDKYQAMVGTIGKRMGLTTLRYQRLDDMIQAIGMPREKACTYCWNGCDPSKKACGRA